MLTRRSFIARVMSAVAAGAVLDVDKLLWEPGAKSIFLPEPRIIIPALVRGDVFTIEGYYLTHPQTGEKLPYLQQFVVLDDVQSDDRDIAFYPRLGHELRSMPVGRIQPLETMYLNAQH